MTMHMRTSMGLEGNRSREMKDTASVNDDAHDGRRIDLTGVERSALGFS
jgi:hypothetical protein